MDATASLLWIEFRSSGKGQGMIDRLSFIQKFQTTLHDLSY